MSIFKNLLNSNNEIKESKDFDSLKNIVIEKYKNILNNTNQYNVELLVNEINKDTINKNSDFNNLIDESKDEVDIYKYKYQLKVMGFIMNEISKKDLLPEFLNKIYGDQNVRH